MTPNEIQDLFDNIPGDEESRVKVAKDVLDTAQKLYEAKSPDLKALAETIGNGSREGELISNFHESFTRI